MLRDLDHVVMFLCTQVHDHCLEFQLLRIRRCLHHQ